MTMRRRLKKKNGQFRSGVPRRQAMETQLTAACDVVNDDPDVSAAVVVLPRRLRSWALNPVDGIQQAHHASLERHDDGGVEIVVGDPPEALPPPAEMIARPRPGWVTRLKRSKAGAP